MLCNRKPKPIDSEILRTMKVYHNVGYAPNPGKEKRNQIPYLKNTDGVSKGKSNIPESPLGRGKRFLCFDDFVMWFWEFNCSYKFSLFSLITICTIHYKIIDKSISNTKQINRKM